MFVELHLHTEYSLLSGVCKTDEVIAFAKENGGVIAVTDTENMFAAAELCIKCREQGVKAIVGCELRVGEPAARSYGGNARTRDTGAVVLLCKDRTGYGSLCRLCEMSYENDRSAAPYVTREELFAHHEGLICLAGGSDGEISRQITNGDISGAEDTAAKYKSIFGSDLYIEVHNHKTAADARLLPLLFNIADRVGIKTVAANSAYYIRREDSRIRQVLTAIADNTELGHSPLDHENDEYYLKIEAEMLELFPNAPETVHESGRIADKCTFEMEFGRLHFPAYELSDEQKQQCRGGNADDYFRLLCKAGLKKRYGTVTKPLLDRLEYELSTIIKMGFTDYFLIVWDFVRYAKMNDIPVGPGRGSGAGSLAAYCIGITDIDPIKYNLIFERFLNPERVSMPDFDIDFCYERREEVIDYVARRYGRERVAQIVTFDTMAARSAVRDVTRVLGLPVYVGDRVARLIPQFSKLTLAEAAESIPQLKELYSSDEQVRRLVDTAKLIEGRPRNTSTHAAGVVICDRPVSDYIPVMERDGIRLAQYTMTHLEQTGLLKMDFLGLRNLTVIHHAAEFVRMTGEDINIRRIPENDPAVFAMLSSGDTFGVFQFESRGMTDLLMKLRPTCIEDLIAALSLYRPGPMDSIPKYLYNRTHPNSITYKAEELEPILKVTNGCIVYQEQVMEICRTMAGYSYGRADLVRRAMAKKKAAVMEKERPAFIEGSVNNGYPRETAEAIFDEMSGFASYAFNKSHAAAYSVVAYQTAYLKCRYFKEFISAYMSVFGGKTAEALAQCRRRRVKILPPDVNESWYGFTPTANGVRFSLSAAKNLGANAVKAIITEREKNGAYKDFPDFVRRLPMLNKKNVDALIKCGALDSLGLNRHEMTVYYDSLAEDSAALGSSRAAGQIDFFTGADSEMPTAAEQSMKPIYEYPIERLIEMEYEIVGVYLSGHPLKNASVLSGAMGYGNILSASALPPDTKTAFPCTITNVREHYTKKGEQMCFAAGEDIDSEIELVVFPETFRKTAALLKTGERVFAAGRTSRTRDDKPSLIVEAMFSVRELIAAAESGTLIITVNSFERMTIDRLTELLSGTSGPSPVIFRLPDKNVSTSSKKCPNTAITPDLIEKLTDIVGEQNVFIKPKIRFL